MGLLLQKVSNITLTEYNAMLPWQSDIIFEMIKANIEEEKSKTHNKREVIS